MNELPVIIAEAGVNHNGDINLALRLVEEAARAGADYVKFQTFNASRMVAASAPLAEYQHRNLSSGAASQLEMLRSLELTPDHHLILKRRAEQLGIQFLSTPFDLESIDFLHSIGIALWKIPSGEITDYPYLRKIATYGGRVVMSTGMSTLDEIEAALDVLEEFGTPRQQVILLHCTTQYPAPIQSVNLRAMDTLRSLGVGGVGYSDHTEGIEIPIAAAALGASVIEKHFTLDRTLPGPDHRASIEPDQLARMVKAVRNVSSALGSPLKRVTEAERPNIAIARKSIVAACPIRKGEILTDENLTVKRPGTGLSPMLWPTIIGHPSPADLMPDQPLPKEAFQ